ncbi:MAG: radical SAM family heme chaperone HemW [Flavobacteriales bacterium]
MSQSSGIYIHIPYCRKACTYCDFYFSTIHDSIPKTVESLVKEMEIRKNELAGSLIQSIYLGGGTPSLLSAENLQQLFNAINTHYDISSLLEVTIETNPDDITPSLLDAWKKMGINRLSIGLQSFVDSELKAMNRAHTAAMGIKSVEMAKNAGFTNITVDLIYGTPWKTASQWEDNVNRVIDMGVPHISAYQLTVEPNTALDHLVRKKNLSVLPEDETAAQFITLRNLLKEAGIFAYEVSNFSKPGFEAVHNRSYWQGLPYAGFGPSAHSYNGKIRKWNVSNLHTWQKAIAEKKIWWEEETLGENEMYNELILTRLRTREGLHIQSVQQLPTHLQKHFATGYKKAATLGHLAEKNGSIFIPEHAVLLTDNICCELFFTSDSNFV